MKGRDSGMPDEAYWATFFDPETALDRLIPTDTRAGNAVEFGCGYGTFTLSAARRMTGLITALDIEPEMVATVRQKAEAELLANIDATICDFVADGTGLPNASQQHAMIFNLLHLEDPVGLLREARRVLREAGSLSVIHWRSDIPTPRGPSLDIRPSLDQCRGWMAQAGFRVAEPVGLEDCCPYHFGLVARRD